MFDLRSLLFSFPAWVTVLGWAQQPAAVEAEAPVAVAAEAVAEAPVEFEVRRAIPVELPSPVQFLPVEIDALPRTLPEGVKTTYLRCEVAEPVIAITFDDGPHAEFTPRLLDILKERNIKATFFLVGRNVVTYPEIVKRMVEEGHEVASHTWSHPLLTGQSATGVQSQLTRTHDAIVKACGVAPLLYRPPYGAARLTQRRAIQEKYGYSTILWDVDPQDWQSPRTVQKVYDRVLARTREGSIVLLHDIHGSTVDAMPATLDALIERGLKMVTVSQLINLETRQPAKSDALAQVADEAAAEVESAPALPVPASAGEAELVPEEIKPIPLVEPKAEPTGEPVKPGRAGTDP